MMTNCNSVVKIRRPFIFGYFETRLKPEGLHERDISGVSGASHLAYPGEVYWERSVEYLLSWEIISLLNWLVTCVASCIHVCWDTDGNLLSREINGWQFNKCHDT